MFELPRGAKAGAFAYAGGQRLEPSLTRGQRLEPSLPRGRQRLEPSLARGQRLEPSLTLDQLPDLLGDGQTQFLMSVGRQMDAIGTVGRDDLRRVEDRDICRS